MLLSSAGRTSDEETEGQLGFVAASGYRGGKWEARIRMQFCWPSNQEAGLTIRPNPVPLNLRATHGLVPLL